MRIIALMNQKGGVGKTTTTANLGAALAEAGQRVCLIDLDPQAHLTINYGVEPTADVISLYDMLIDDRSFLEAVHTIDKNIALVPSSIDLAAAEIELVNVIGRETLLKQKLETAQHDFDFILLDCPPSLGLLTINALSAANEVIIPMQPHFLALQGVAKLLETVRLVNQRMNPALKVCGIVLTMYDAQTKLTTEVVAELNGFIAAAAGKPLPWANAKVFNTKIRRNIKLAECPSFGETILKYDSSSNGAFDYRNLARELMGLPSVAAPAPKASAKTSVTVAPVPPGAALPPKPVMPPALVAAMKSAVAKKPAAVAPASASGAASAKTQATPAAKTPAAPPAPVKAAEIAKTVEPPVAPIAATKLAEVAKPAEQTRAVDATKTADIAKTVELQVAPVAAIKPTEPTRAVEAAKPVDLVKSVDAAVKTPVVSKAPVVAKPPAAEKPVDVVHRVEPAKPAEPLKPTVASKPLELSKSTDAVRPPTKHIIPVLKLEEPPRAAPVAAKTGTPMPQPVAAKSIAASQSIAGLQPTVGGSTVGSTAPARRSPVAGAPASTSVPPARPVATPSSAPSAPKPSQLAPNPAKPFPSPVSPPPIAPPGGKPAAPPSPTLRPPSAKVQVTVAPAIDQAKLAASNVAPPASDSAGRSHPPHESPHESTEQEVA